MLSISEQTPDVCKPTSFTGGRTWCLADGQPLEGSPRDFSALICIPGSWRRQLPLRSADAWRRGPWGPPMHLGGVVRHILFGLF